MYVTNLSAVLMAAGLLIAAPAFAQTSAAPKQQTQEGGPSMPAPCNHGANANPGADPDCKQRTQEGGLSTPEPCNHAANANPGADPDCKQRTQSLTPSDAQAPAESGEKHK